MGSLIGILQGSHIDGDGVNDGSDKIPHINLDLYNKVYNEQFIQRTTKTDIQAHIDAGIQEFKENELETMREDERLKAEESLLKIKEQMEINYKKREAELLAKNMEIEKRNIEEANKISTIKKKLLEEMEKAQNNEKLLRDELELERKSFEFEKEKVEQLRKDFEGKIAEAQRITFDFDTKLEARVSRHQIAFDREHAHLLRDLQEEKTKLSVEIATYSEKNKQVEYLNQKLDSVKRFL